MTKDMTHIDSVPRQIMTALRAALVFLVLCGLVYTGIATGLGRVLFPHQATGSLIYQQETAVGSSLVAQPFTSPWYFYSRPSAAGYDPTATGGSNLAPSNPELRQRAQEESARIQSLENVQATAIPVDLLAASGAGLDPHISPEAALLQAARVAAARGVDVEQIKVVIDEVQESPQWGLFGKPRVNVLQLNLSLDQQMPVSKN